jgi:acetoacetate decarboxylase
MGFVKTPEEIARIEHVMRHPRFVNSEMLRVDFLSDPDVIAHILPPPLEPADQPVVGAMVGRWQSNCVGDYNGGALYVAARHEGVEGDYVLGMYMSADAAMIFGRDLFGEPKKQSTSQLHRSGSRFRAYVERGGTRLIELEADLPTELGPSEGGGVNFNFKARPASAGAGLEEDAVLTLASFRSTIHAAYEGTGSVTLRGTVHDPVDEIPVVSVVRASFVECDLAADCRSVARVPAARSCPTTTGATTTGARWTPSGATLAGAR